MAGELWDAPNKQVLGLDPPWVEGTGGDGAEVSPTSDLDSMTKAQLLDVAAERGVEVDPALTKAEIREALG